MRLPVGLLLFVLDTEGVVRGDIEAVSMKVAEAEISDVMLSEEE